MGLSGRKEKQRIGNDPRNLSWADDASRFGSSYLSKFGWDASKGLGATGEGRTSHIKVSQKLDMMGIGAAHQKDPNGIAWKQSRDFENLLKRLNETSGKEEGEAVDVEMKVNFIPETVQVKGEDDQKVDGKEREKKEKKRKEKEERKEKKKERKRTHDPDDEDRTEKKKRRKSSEEASEQKEAASPAPTSVPVKQSAPPRYRAHRARAIAAKSIASKSSSHISEILGIAPSTSASASASESTSNFASGSATPADQGKLTIISELEKLTTSTKSVADYFKEKLQLKTSKSSLAAPSTPADSVSPESSTPAPGLGMTRRVDDEERPGGGLGFGSGIGFGGGGLGFSKVRLEVKEECNVVEEATMSMGLKTFSSLMSSRFLTSETLGFENDSATPEVSESRIEAVAEEEPLSSSSEDENREERKRRRKAEKEKKKSEAGEREKKMDKKEKKRDDQARVEKIERKEKKDKKDMYKKDKKEKKSKKTKDA